MSKCTSTIANSNGNRFLTAGRMAFSGIQEHSAVNSAVYVVWRFSRFSFGSYRNDGLV